MNQRSGYSPKNLKRFSSLILFLFWGILLPTKSLAQIDITQPSNQFKSHFILKSSQNHRLHGFELNAIVQLKGLNLPPPQTRGEATIPLQVLEGSQVFTLELTIGRKVGNFLLDTGASTTLISTPMIQQLGLVGQPIASEALTSAVAGDECPEMRATLHRLPEIKIEDVRVQEMRALEFSNTLIPGGLSGVFGMDFLRHFDLKLNPETQQLKFLKPTPIVSREIDSGIPLKSHLGVMLAAIEINGKGSFTFMLDTGADTLFISQNLAQKLKLDQASREPIQVQGFCGLEEAERSTLKQVKIGEHQQQNLEAVILSSPSVLDLLEVDGILGQSFLNHYYQHWRFSSSDNSDNFKGSLILTPVSSKVKLF